VVIAVGSKEVPGRNFPVTRGKSNSNITIILIIIYPTLNLNYK
jgi:hypothetical protein